MRIEGVEATWLTATKSLSGSKAMLGLTAFSTVCPLDVSMSV